jgi:hypothetical protein
MLLDIVLWFEECEGRRLLPEVRDGCGCVRRRSFQATSPPREGEAREGAVMSLGPMEVASVGEVPSLYFPPGGEIP